MLGGTFYLQILLARLQQELYYSTWITKSAAFCSMKVYLRLLLPFSSINSTFFLHFYGLDYNRNQFIQLNFQFFKDFSSTRTCILISGSMGFPLLQGFAHSTWIQIISGALPVHTAFCSTHITGWFKKGFVGKSLDIAKGIMAPEAICMMPKTKIEPQNQV